jgi:hypothetical protein
MAKKEGVMRKFLVMSVCVMVLFGGVVMQAQAQGPDPKDYPPITGYYSPCQGGTEAVIFSWHGVNQDGLPPVDLDRRSVDFLCVEKQVYAPYGGTVYGTTPRWGGLILIDDAEHDACINLLGMVTIDVADGDVLEAGDFLGLYNYHIHIAVTDGTCAASNWYNWDARSLERPVRYTELGRVVPSDILEPDAWPFVSQNPTGGGDRRRSGGPGFSPLKYRATGKRRLSLHNRGVYAAGLTPDRAPSRPPSFCGRRVGPPAVVRG